VKLLAFGLALCLVPSSAHALLNGSDPVPERLATGSLQPALAGGASALRENPALLATRTGWDFGAGYTNALGLAELPVWSAWGSWSDSSWAAGGWMREFRAGDVFREDLVVGALAMRGKHWAAGVGVQGVGIAFGQGLGSSWSGDLSAGALFMPVDWLALGASGRQLLQSPVGGSSETLERELLGGLAVTTTDRRFTTALSVATKPDSEHRPTWQLGQVIRPAPWLSLRGGVRLEPLELSCGAGLEWQGLDLDFSIGGDVRLGTQTAFSLGWHR
jgi:hypothetical protein